ncbi:MAG: MFS transporter [Halanaerobiales bacterium]|nr:MFS transporter [Halanaerobiales bacterium]
MKKFRAEKAYMMAEIIYTIGFTLTSTVSTIFLLSKPGMDYTKVGIVFGFFLASMAICDFPTGNLADLFGRKTIYAIGMILLSIQQLLYGIGNSFLVLIFAAIIGGVATAQLSGSFSAWLFDELKKKDKTEELSTVLGKTRTLTSVMAMIIAVLLGTLYVGSMQLLYFMSFAIYFLLGLGIFIFLPENYGARKRGIAISVDTLSYYIKNPALIRVSFFIIIIFSCYSVFTFYWQPISLQLGIASANLGYMYCFYLAATALAGLLVVKFAKKFSDETLFVICFVALGFSFLSVYLYTHIVTLCFSMVLFGIGFGSFMPIYSRHLHGMIPSEIRSSVISLLSTIASIGAVISEILIGKLIDIYNVKVSLLIGIILIASTAIIFAIFGFRTNIERK